MSLLDALLLDPLPIEAWVTPRTDGVVGSGTEDDPYDGSGYLKPPVIVNTITFDSSNTKLATATTATPHGFQAAVWYLGGDYVQIAGVTGNDAAHYNGVFLISVLNAYQFTYVPLGTPLGNAPTQSIITCQSQRSRFDDVMQSVPIAISITPGGIGNPANLAVVFAPSHGLQDQSQVLIGGATGQDARYYNGIFTITIIPDPAQVESDSFTYVMAGVPNSAPVGNLWCRLLSGPAVGRGMALLPPVAVRLGPGTLPTQGSAVWAPRSGMKMLGSGMGVSVLKLAPIGSAEGWAIGVPLYASLVSFEARDFTIDCNIAGQGPPTGICYCAGVAVGSTQVRLRRIRAINFGTQGQIRECYPLAVGGTARYPVVGPGAVNRIEDCIVEQPGFNNYWMTTCLLAGGAGPDLGGATIYSPGCATRNSYVNCEYRANPVPIQSIVSSSGSTFLVTTTLPHGHADGDWVRISGVSVSGQPYYNSFNGSYPITLVSPTQFKYVPYGQLSTAAPYGDMWVGKWPSHYVKVTGLSFLRTEGPPPNTPYKYTITITTATPHFLVPFSMTVINGVAIANQPQPPATLPDFDGWLQVTDVGGGLGDPTKFTYVVRTLDTIGQTDVSIAGGVSIAPFFQALWVIGDSTVYEGNHASNCSPGGYHDTFPSRGHVFRNNYLRKVLYGTDQNMAWVADETYNGVIRIFPLSSLTNKQGLIRTSVATATTPYPHGFTPGIDQVLIYNIAPDDGTGQYYMGKPATSQTPFAQTAFVITATPTPTTFQYQMLGIPTNDASSARPNTMSYATGPTPPSLPFAPTYSQGLLGGPSVANPLTFAEVNGQYVATATVSSDMSYFPNGHTLQLGETVFISKANPSVYNGYFTVIAVPNSSQFQYILPSNPGTPSSTGYFGRLWVGGKIIQENNVIELAPPQTYYSWGMRVGVVDANPPAIFPQVLLRRNVIRATDGVADPPFGWSRIGLSVYSGGGVIMEENVVDASYPTPIQFKSCSNTQLFANQTSAGALVPGFNKDANANVNELANVEDTILLAI